MGRPRRETTLTSRINGTRKWKHENSDSGALMFRFGRDGQILMLRGVFLGRGSGSERRARRTAARMGVFHVRLVGACRSKAGKAGC